MFLTAWLFWTTLSCWSLSEVSSLPPATINLSPPKASDAEEGELPDDIPFQKRFIRYMFRPPTFWTSAENMSPDGQKRGYEKNFLRFGRNDGGVVLDEDMSPLEEHGQNDFEKKSGRNFLRFGREAVKKNRNFLRFGRNDGHFIHYSHDDGHFVPFGNDGPFNSFSSAGEAPASDIIGSEELEAAKRSPRNFLRFGRASDNNFLRFGRDRNYLRFGRSVSGHVDNDHEEKSLNFGESAVAPSSSPSSPTSQILDSSSSAESKKRSPRGKRSIGYPFIVYNPDNAYEYVMEDELSLEKRPDRFVISGQAPLNSGISPNSNSIQANTMEHVVVPRNGKNFLRYG